VTSRLGTGKPLTFFYSVFTNSERSKMEHEEEVERDAEGELVRLDYDLDTLKGERAIKVIVNKTLSPFCTKSHLYHYRHTYLT
jgi:hypothetical protein